jgi:hypothetical protein
MDLDLKKNDTIELEIFNVFTEINDQYSAISLIENFSTAKNEESNYSSEIFISPWNTKALTPIIKNIDYDFFTHHNEDIVFICKETITFMIDHAPEKNRNIKIKVFNKCQNSRNYFRNTKNLQSINCTYTFEKDFFIILEKNYHIISCNNKWFFIKINIDIGELCNHT